MSLLDLSSLLVLLEPEMHFAQAAFQYPENAHCRHFGRAKDVLTHENNNENSGVDLNSTMLGLYAPPIVHLALSLHPGPKNLSKGFVFGSDPETCDVLLGKSKPSGISGNHFSINVDWRTGNPLITCLTPDDATGISITSGRSWKLYLRNAWKVIEPGAIITIRIFENMKLVVHSPCREGRELAYHHNVQEYFRRYQEAVPEMTNLRLYDPEPTPLLVSRGRGLLGTEYFPVTTTVGEKIVLCEAWSHQVPTADSQKLSIKRFRTTRNSWQRHASEFLPRLRGLQHPCITVLEDIITDRTEYMPVYLDESSGTLTARLSNEEFFEFEACQIITQILEGLRFLHANGIIHSGLCPSSVRIKSGHRPAMTIEISDIGLYPHVELDDSQERELYVCQLNRACNTPIPIWDTWSAGVVGLKILFPSQFPARKSLKSSAQEKAKIQKQRYWVDSLAARALAICESEPPGIEGKKFAARFLTRVVQVGATKRLTAEQCLQDDWIKYLRGEQCRNLESYPGPDDPICGSEAAGPINNNIETGFVHEEGEAVEGSDRDTDAEGSDGYIETEKPQISAPKGKQPKQLRPVNVVAPDHQYRQRSPKPHSAQSTRGTVEELRGDSITSSRIQHRQRSANPQILRPSGETSKASQRASVPSQSNQDRKRSASPQNPESPDTTPRAARRSSIASSSHEDRQRSASPQNVKSPGATPKGSRRASVSLWVDQNSPSSASREPSLRPSWGTPVVFYDSNIEPPESMSRFCSVPAEDDGPQPSNASNAATDGSVHTEYYNKTSRQRWFEQHPTHADESYEEFYDDDVFPEDLNEDQMRRLGRTTSE